MKTSFYNFILLMVSIALLFACQSPAGNEDDPHNENETLTENQEKHTEWSYEGETSPEHWDEILKNSDCDGKMQSPINIYTREVSKTAIGLDLKSSFYTDSTDIESVTNNGHSIQYNFTSEDNYLTFKENQFILKQFHFHSPSEHTLNGVRYPLEIHMVHYNKEIDQFLVVGFFAEQGEPDPAFTFLEKYLPLEVGETKKLPQDVFDFSSAYAFIEQEEEIFYSYKGSLTTPPCSEKVNWLVSGIPVKASLKQIKILKELMPQDNYRDIQELNGRTIESEEFLIDYREF